MELRFLKEVKKQIKMKKFLPFIVGVVLIAALGVGGYFLFTKVISPAKIDSSKHQAVFLSNGQVYFGKVKNIGKQYAELSNIYYLILKQPLQQQTTTDTTTEKQTPEYTLIKLGQELHGPIDKMIINRDHILFIENLKDDGKVAKAISDYQNTQK